MGWNNVRDTILWGPSQWGWKEKFTGKSDKKIIKSEEPSPITPTTTGATQTVFAGSESTSKLLDETNTGRKKLLGV